MNGSLTGTDRTESSCIRSFPFFRQRLDQVEGQLGMLVEKLLQVGIQPIGTKLQMKEHPLRVEVDQEILAKLR